MRLSDKEYESVDRRVKALVKKWVGPLGLGWWKCTVSVVRAPEDMPTTGNRQRTDAGWDIAASAHVAWEYRDAKISINAEVAHGRDDEDLEDSFLHEVSHVLVNQMRSIAKEDGYREGWMEHEESVCTSLAKTIKWSYLAGRDAARDERKRKH